MDKLKLASREEEKVTPSQPSGVLTEWNDERGFGFITPAGGGSRVFLHISGLRKGTPRPTEGDNIYYTLSKDEKGRPCAIEAYSSGKSTQGTPRRPWNYMFGGILAKSFWLGIVVVAVLAAVTRNCLTTILLGSVINSYLTIVCYKTDKYFAQQQLWRIPEACLHCWELLWGWPGALWAQRHFRHKNAKTSFQCVFWACVILNCLGSICLIHFVSGEQFDQIHSQLFDNLKHFIH